MLEKSFDPQSIEDKHYARWESSGAFSCNPESDKEPFCLMMPPPNVTGSLHVGHALTFTLQDIIVRYWRMKGRDTLWQPGTDHASIAVHMVLEKQFAQEGKDRFDYGREAFLEKAWEWKEYSAGTITSQLRKLGTTADWPRERFTMDEGLSKAVTEAFVRLYDDGLIYRAERLVNWDPERQSVISDIEVNSKEVKGSLWYLQYPIEGDEARSITVATTRPETMLGDTAIAVHPDDERYKDLVGKFAVLPIVGRLLPIVADNYVDPEHGSGAVKITPAHDFNDFEIGQRHNLEVINIFDKYAAINDNGPEHLQGLDRFEARKRILKELEELDAVEKVEDIKHAVPYGERSGVVIEPFLTIQWFCDTPTLAKKAIEAIDTGETRFVPKQYENMYMAWMKNQIPWCISRQLWWGHQIPAWYGPDDEVIVARTEDEAQAKALKKYGKSVELKRDDDILDTWFSSALWPFSTLGWPEKTPELERYYPTDVLVTGFDIITFWVSRMMMFGIYLMGDVPFKDIYIHALVRDENGQKMSKSKGNVLNPLDMIEKYGTDALRFTIASMAAQGRDIRLSEKRIEGYRNFTTKIWNAARYCEMNGCHFDPEFKPFEVKNDLNRWIVSKLVQMKDIVSEAIESYKYNDAAYALYHFVWGDFCDWYLEFTKPILHGEEDVDAEETRMTTGWILEQIFIIANPIMPFMTEELSQALSGRKDGDFIMTSEWPTYEANDVRFGNSIDTVDWICRFVTEIRSLRADMNIPAGSQVPVFLKNASDATMERLESYGEIIKTLARIKDISFTDEVLSEAIQTVVDEASIMIPVGDLIDLDQERKRLGKQIEKLKSEMKKIEVKLNNQKFIQNAPEDIIEEQKDRLSKTQESLDKYTNALKNIGG